MSESPKSQSPKPGEPRDWNLFLAPLRGAARLARGRMDGLQAFGSTPDAVLASLAPLLAVPFAGALWALLHGQVERALTAVGFTVTAQLAPLVLSHGLARLWGREEGWLRYAAAYNWLQWAILAVALVLPVVLEGFGLPDRTAIQIYAFLLLGYVLWLNGRLARHGLGLSWPRSALLVAVVLLGSTLLAIGPLVAQAVVTGEAAGQTGPADSAP